MRTSFIVPVYKPDIPLFRKVIKALRTQSLKAFEVIFVLDGPDEHARAVIEEESKGIGQGVRTIEIPHGGACAARNAGARIAVGDILVFWDCDCLIEPDAALAWSNIFEDKPEVGFIYSGYKFLGEKGGISSEPFDPWTLRVRNYISTCFPVRRKFLAEWDESLESLQDWDFWLSVVEKGAIGKFLQGYAFSTAYPTPTSISGKGCTSDVWLARMDKVRAKHNIPIRKVCVSSLDHVTEGIRLAKLIDADFQRIPNDKPNHYETVIQVGLNLASHDTVRAISSIIGDPAFKKKMLFWAAEDITTVYNGISFTAIKQYRDLLNKISRQFVEDKHAKDLMEDAGFKVEIMPMPIRNEDSIMPLPEKPRWLVDVSSAHGVAMNAVELSLPDMILDVNPRTLEIKDFTGVVHFQPDKTITPTMKRCVLTGRHVISNVEQPFMGFVTDDTETDKFIPALVNKIRGLAVKGQSDGARKYWEKQWGPERLMEAVNAG